MDCYFVEMTDGVSIVYIQDKDTNIEKEIDKWAPEHKAKVLSFKKSDHSEVPSDRSYRNAWRLHQGQIKVKADAAKEIALTRLRAKREEKFKPLDNDFILALEKNDTAKIEQIKSEKQLLRDATNPLKSLTLPEFADDALLQTIKELEVV